MTSEPAGRNADRDAFEAIYNRARGEDPRSVPWAHGEPHPMLQPWLNTSPRPKRDTSKALVVGSGLGDDAEALAALGWSVEAFDVSESAVAWSMERFPDSTVTYSVRDLFALPSAWDGAFDLVVEVHTIQSIPVTQRQAAIRAISATVARNGTLVVVAMTRRAEVPLRGRPWPLTPHELSSFSRYGLTRTDQQIVSDPAADRPGRVRCHWQR